MRPSPFAVRLTALLAALTCLVPALAADDEPLRPEEAYRYVVADTGDAIEIDWAIEDGYYLYRNKLGFESGTDGVALGAAGTARRPDARR